MKPQDTPSTGNPKHNSHKRGLSVPARDAAAQVVRSQIDAIYNGDHVVAGAETKPKQEAEKPVIANAVDPAAHAEQWKQYHSAWQEYYQKYYEHYYNGHMRRVLAERTTPALAAEVKPHTPTLEEAKQAEAESKEESLVDLRQKLFTNVESSARKVRKSRHFIPIAAAICVVVVFGFLQYNRVLISNVRAYVSPGSIDPQNIVVDPTADVAVGPDPKLIIPKINVDVPAVYGVGYDHDSQMKAMEKGVAHFSIPGASSVPGQVGNTVLSGHSSNDLFDPGEYKFIFAQLDKLNTGDTIYTNYESKRYTYTITKKEVVLPTEVSKLTYQTDKPVLTLITCTPLGTAQKRLLITAEQVTPDPSAATAAPATAAGGGSEPLPGNSPTLTQRLFGGGN